MRGAEPCSATGLPAITNHSYTVTVRLTFSIDDDVLRLARLRAAALGTTVDQLVREYLERLAGPHDPAADAEEFERL